MKWDTVEEDGRYSEFNAAAFKMQRLHKLMDEANELNGNLVAYNIENGVFNYELKFKRLESLYFEVDSKLKVDEMENGIALISAITTFLKKYPIHTEVKNKIYPYQTRKKINHQNLNILKEWMFKLECLVRKLIDNHGMDTRYEDESALF